MMMMMSVTVVSFLHAVDYPYLLGFFRIPWSFSVHGPPCFQPLSDGKTEPIDANYLKAVFMPGYFHMIRMTKKLQSSPKKGGIPDGRRLEGSSQIELSRYPDSGAILSASTIPI